MRGWSGDVSAFGCLVCLLSSPLVVSSSSVYPFQTGSPVVEWISPAAYGLGLDCGSGLEKQLGGGRISCRQYVGQRLDRISKLGHLGTTESVCLYDLCQNLDRIVNLGAQRGRRGPGGFFGQDANFGRHGDGFCATLDRHLSEGLRGSVSLSPSPFYKSDRGLGGANHTSMPTSRQRRHCPKGR